MQWGGDIGKSRLEHKNYCSRSIKKGMAAGFGSIRAPFHLEVICWGGEQESGGLPEVVGSHW